MSAIDPNKAVDVMELLESALRTADPDFKPARSAGVKTALGALAVTRQHAAAAMINGQNASAMLNSAQRQIAEAAMLIRTVAASAPAGDANAEKFAAIISGLSE